MGLWTTSGGETCRWKYLWDGGFGYLFDLIDDPAETVNVYSRHETLARELEALSLTDW